jgi:hypothetical protein
MGLQAAAWGQGAVSCPFGRRPLGFPGPLDLEGHRDLSGGLARTPAPEGVAGPRPEDPEHQGLEHLSGRAALVVAADSVDARRGDGPGRIAATREAERH